MSLQPSAAASTRAGSPPIPAPGASLLPRGCKVPGRPALLKEQTHAIQQQRAAKTAHQESSSRVQPSDYASNHQVNQTAAARLRQPPILATPCALARPEYPRSVPHMSLSLPTLTTCPQLLAEDQVEPGRLLLACLPAPALRATHLCTVRAVEGLAMAPVPPSSFNRPQIKRACRNGALHTSSLLQHSVAGQ